MKNAVYCSCLDLLFLFSLSKKGANPPCTVYIKYVSGLHLALVVGARGSMVLLTVPGVPRCWAAWMTLDCSVVSWSLWEKLLPLTAAKFTSTSSSPCGSVITRAVLYRSIDWDFPLACLQLRAQQFYTLHLCCESLKLYLFGFWSVIAFLVNRVNNKLLVIFTSRYEKTLQRCLYQNFYVCVGNEARGMKPLLGCG